MREGEEDGVDYFYLSKNEFEEKIKEAMNDIKPDPLFKNNLWQQIVLNHAEKSRRKPVNKKLFIDSGAFTAWTKQKPIDVEEYIKFGLVIVILQD